jgi:hypothetical protein
MDIETPDKNQPAPSEKLMAKNVLVIIGTALNAKIVRIKTRGGGATTELPYQNIVPIVSIISTIARPNVTVRGAPL